MSGQNPSMAALEAPAVPLVVALTILCALAAAVVIFRFISIDIRARKVKLHDWFCVLSLVGDGDGVADSWLTEYRSSSSHSPSHTSSVSISQAPQGPSRA